MAGHVLAILIGVVVAVIVVLLVLSRRAARQVEERPVLPSHYYSLLHATPEQPPGQCQECGTRNSGEYVFCRECSAKLPNRTSPNADLRRNVQ